MDPVFNDTSTYQRTEIPQEQVHTQERDGWSRIAQDGQGLASGVRRDQGSFQGAQPMEHSMMNGMPALASQFYPSNAAGADQQVGNMNMNIHMNSNFAFAASSHSHAPPVVPSSQGYGPASDIDNAGRTAPSLKPNHIDDGNENTGLGAAGVNYQTLLDNLSQSSASATTSAIPNPNPSGVPSTLAKGSSFLQGPTDESLHPGIQSARNAQSVDLPSRPSLQDPSLPPNYASSDAHAYHQATGTPSTASPSAYAAQSSNNAHYDPQPLPAVAPGTESGVGNLPPPPMASFQRPGPSPTGESQGSQEGSAASKGGRPEKQPIRVSKPGDEDQPWGPDVQKKYDEFLRDERVYVTEGLWDRFPVGSRLFVGQYPPIQPSQSQLSKFVFSRPDLCPFSLRQSPHRASDKARHVPYLPLLRQTGPNLYQASVWLYPVFGSWCMSCSP